MLNPNTRANTVISQSFIASEFQGFNDPFVSSQPTSSLNQFVRSKQTSDSGFIQQGQNQSFGFNNITANHQPTRLQNLSRKTNQTVSPNVVMPKPVPQVNQVQQFNQEYQNNNQQYQNNNNQSYQNVNPTQYNQQMALQERYISPGIIKSDSPTKLNQFINQNNSNNFRGQNLNQQQNFQQNFQQYNQTNTQFNSNQHNYDQKSFSTNVNSNSQFSNQQPRSNTQINQNTNSRPISTQVGKQTGSTSTIGQRLKLNISQQFSNSFTLNCVTQPQRSNILQMKKRQRQYRKSIQNFFI